MELSKFIQLMDWKEDNSKQGELTYYSEIKYLQSNIYRVSGKFDELNDSLT